MTPEQYIDLKQFVIDMGYAKDIDYYEDVKLSQYTEIGFFEEAAYVIINSGMKNQIAEGIWHKVRAAIDKGIPVFSVFKHEGKAKAIEYIWRNRKLLFEIYKATPGKDKLDCLEELPWIGPITKYHLAKNLGMDVCKPDRHLVRIAEKHETTPEKLCQKLSDATGDRIGTVDYVIWRAANLGKI